MTEQQFARALELAKWWQARDDGAFQVASADSIKCLADAVLLLHKQLAAAIEAKDELADIAVSETLDETWSAAANQRTLARIAELGKVGRR